MPSPEMSAPEPSSQRYTVADAGTTNAGLPPKVPTDPSNLMNVPAEIWTCKVALGISVVVTARAADGRHGVESVDVLALIGTSHWRSDVAWLLEPGVRSISGRHHGPFRRLEKKDQLVGLGSH